MAIDFPNSPTIGDTYTTNGKTYRWDGTVWGIYGTFSRDFTASDTEPTGVADGHIWYRSDQSQTLIRYDNTWVEVGSAGGFDSSSTSFPSSLDSGTGFAAVEALQAKVGVDGSAVTSSHDYILSNGALSTLNVDSGVLVVDETNDRVGINDSTPSYSLDVNGVIRATSEFRLGSVRVGGYVDYSSSASFINITIGNGTVYAWYTKVDKLVHYWGNLTLGSTSSVGNSPALVTPTIMYAPNANMFPCMAYYEEAGVQGVAGTLTGTNNLMWFRLHAPGAGVVNAWPMSASTPFSWGTNDVIAWNLIYQEG